MFSAPNFSSFFVSRVCIQKSTSQTILQLQQGYELVRPYHFEIKNVFDARFQACMYSDCTQHGSGQFKVKHCVRWTDLGMAFGRVQLCVGQGEVRVSCTQVQGLVRVSSQ